MIPNKIDTKGQLNLIKPQSIIIIMIIDVHNNFGLEFFLETCYRRFNDYL